MSLRCYQPLIHNSSSRHIFFFQPNLRHMLGFAELFPDEKILYTLCRELSWSHFRSLIYPNDSLQREFDLEMCRVERWNVRTLHQKIQGMLFERTALSKKSEKLARQELATLRDSDRLTPDLVFRDPYFLDFLFRSLFRVPSVSVRGTSSGVS